MNAREGRVVMHSPPTEPKRYVRQIWFRRIAVDALVAFRYELFRTVECRGILQYCPEQNINTFHTEEPKERKYQVLTITHAPLGII